MKVKWLGTVDYISTYAEMKEFTNSRTESTLDEIWMCEHYPTFTQGLAGKAEHILELAHIPIVQTDRGGQITFHSPGQIVAYPLIDLKRLGIFVKEYVYRLEESILKTLLHFHITGHRVIGAPGIYINLGSPTGHEILKLQPYTVKTSPDTAFNGLGKIAALGIKVSRNKTYHGLSLNVQMDLKPFELINPCGYFGLNTVDLWTIGVRADIKEVASVLSKKLSIYLSK
jgi:lipoyl(octanoyl) transferase